MPVIFKVVYILPEDWKICAANGEKTRGDRSLWSRKRRYVREAPAEPDRRERSSAIQKMPGAV